MARESILGDPFDAFTSCKINFPLALDRQKIAMSYYYFYGMFISSSTKKMFLKTLYF